MVKRTFTEKLQFFKQNKTNNNKKQFFFLLLKLDFIDSGVFRNQSNV